MAKESDRDVAALKHDFQLRLCRVLADDPSGALRFIGSGTLVSPRHLLTAKHNVEVVLGHSLVAEDPYVLQEEVRHKNILLSGMSFPSVRLVNSLSYMRDYDIAILTIDGPIRSFEYFPISALNFDVDQGITFAGGFTDDRNAADIVSIQVSSDDVDSGTYLYVPTLPAGTSGGGVIDAFTKEIVGVAISKSDELGRSFLVPCDAFRSFSEKLFSLERADDGFFNNFWEKATSQELETDRIMVPIFFIVSFPFFYWSFVHALHMIEGVSYYQRPNSDSATVGGETWFDRFIGPSYLMICAPIALFLSRRYSKVSFVAAASVIILLPVLSQLPLFWIRDRQSVSAAILTTFNSSLWYFVILYNRWNPSDSLDRLSAVRSRLRVKAIEALRMFRDHANQWITFVLIFLSGAASIFSFFLLGTLILEPEFEYTYDALAQERRILSIAFSSVFLYFLCVAIFGVIAPAMSIRQRVFVLLSRFSAM